VTAAGLAQAAAQTPAEAGAASKAGLAKVCITPQSPVWMTQNVLLADRAEMDRIADAVRKIQKHAADLARA
jgi:hypothetical protein